LAENYHLYQEVKEKLTKKPRTSRKIARKNYLKVAKIVPLPSQKERRKTIGQQRGYIQRNLYHFSLFLAGILPPLAPRVVSFSQMSFNQILIWQGFQSISQNKYLKNF
jgi:hypothetical protein